MMHKLRHSIVSTLLKGSKNKTVLTAIIFVIKFNEFATSSLGRTRLAAI